MEDFIINLIVVVLVIAVIMLWVAVKQLLADKQRIDNYLHEVSNRVYELEYADEETAKKTAIRSMQ